MELSSLTDAQKVERVHNMMRPYQQGALSCMVRDGKRLSYMDMGTGKTLVAMTAIFQLEAFPCIIVCSKSAMAVWEEELKKWYDEPCTIYSGTKPQRDKKFQKFVTEGHRFIICNYAMAEELGLRFGIIKPNQAKLSRTSAAASNPTPGAPKHKWNINGLIADEIQLGGLFNHKTKTYRAFQLLSRAIPHKFLLTGTPYRRGVIDFYGPLSLIDETRFDSYWRFVNHYCVTINTGFGKSIERNPANAKQFRAMLRKYADIIKKSDVLTELPPKQRVSVPVVLEGEQKRVYEELSKELLALTDEGELLITPTVLALMMRQRQLLVAPQALGLKSRGAAIDMLVEKVGELIDNNKPFVVFTPFKTAVPYIEQAIREDFETDGRIVDIYTITGGLTAEEFGERWKGFQYHNGKRPSVLICVIKSGASFQATRASSAFFLGYEWDFNQNEQAEDRLNRMGQKEAVMCYYMMHKGTVDEDVALALNDKKYSADIVLSSEEEFVRRYTSKLSMGGNLK